MTKLSIPQQYSQINSDPSICPNTFRSEKAYSSELNRLKAKCVNINDNRITAQQKSTYRRITTKSISSQSMVDQYCGQYLNNKLYQKILEFNLTENSKFCKKYLEKHRKIEANNIISLNNYPQQIEFKSKNLAIDSASKYSLTVPNNSSGKKCFIYRNTPYYKTCILKHYKCFKYKDNPTMLKNCRKRFKVIVPIKN